MNVHVSHASLRRPAVVRRHEVQCGAKGERHACLEMDDGSLVLPMHPEIRRFAEGEQHEAELARALAGLEPCGCLQWARRLIETRRRPAVASRYPTLLERALARTRAVMSQHFDGQRDEHAMHARPRVHSVAFAVDATAWPAPRDAGDTRRFFDEDVWEVAVRPGWLVRVWTRGLMVAPGFRIDSSNMIGPVLVLDAVPTRWSFADRVYRALVAGRVFHQNQGHVLWVRRALVTRSARGGVVIAETVRELNEKAKGW